jgi:hypothetical protein
MGSVIIIAVKTLGKERLKIYTVVMLAAQLCFRNVKDVVVMKCSPLRAVTYFRARKRIIMSNGRMLCNRGNGINSEGNLSHCAAVLVRFMVM